MSEYSTSDDNSDERYNCSLDDKIIGFKSQARYTSVDYRELVSLKAEEIDTLLVMSSNRLNIETFNVTIATLITILSSLHHSSNDEKRNIDDADCNSSSTNSFISSPNSSSTTSTSSNRSSKSSFSSDSRSSSSKSSSTFLISST